MKKIISSYPITSLILTSILCGTLWRSEIEWHGWQVLIWLTYFHYAVPVGFILFLLWSNLVIELDLKRRLLINLTTLLYGAGMYFALSTSLTYLFAGGPYGFVAFMSMPEWEYLMLLYSSFVVIPLMPIGAFLLMKIFHLAPPMKFLMLSFIGILFSIPISILLLELLRHKGGSNFIHAIKSGILAALWVFSMGLLIVGSKARSISAR